MPTQHTTTARDFFLHMLSVITLYGSAIAITTILFQMINMFIPDALTDYYGQEESYRSAIRFALATLIVMFPVYIWSVWFLDKAYVSDPTKLHSGVRKFLHYFTLFVGGLILIGDLITLVFNLLDGELTMRGFLKIVVVFVVVGSIFFYYLHQVRRASSEQLST